MPRLDDQQRRAVCRYVWAVGERDFAESDYSKGFVGGMVDQIVEMWGNADGWAMVRLGNRIHRRFGRWYPCGVQRQRRHERKRQPYVPLPGAEL